MKLNLESRNEMSIEELLNYMSIDIKETLKSKFSKLRISSIDKKKVIENSVLLGTFFRLLLRTSPLPSLDINIILNNWEYRIYFRFICEVNDFNELVSIEWLRENWLLYVKWKYYLFEMREIEKIKDKIPGLFNRAEKQMISNLQFLKENWVSDEVAKLVL